MKSKQQLELRIKNNRAAVLIVNIHSRKGSRLFKQAQSLLQEAGITLTASYPIKDPRYINQTVKRALVSRPELLIVGSGDGTVSEIVDHLAYSDTVLGFIPLGTTNNFARSLGIPIDIHQAIDTIVNGKVADVDLGKVNDDYFANVASIGISVEIANTVSAHLKKRFGRIAYALAGFKALLHHRSFTATIMANGRKYEIKTHQIIIANGRFHGGTMIATDASIDSHDLVIFHLGDKSRLRLLRSLVLFGLKRPRTLREGNFIVTEHAKLVTHPKHRVEIDGEDKAVTPVEITLAPEALRIMVPQTFIDD